jgi:hypothetical protein
MAKKIKLTNGDDTFNGKGKDEIINAKAGDDNVSGGGGNDKINGGEGNDVLKGGAGDDTLNGGTENDILLGGSGDDTLNGGSGTNDVDGGDGDDTVVLDGNYADAKITRDGDGYQIVTALGTTTVKNVELFKFADGTKSEDDLIVEGKTFALTTTLDNVVGTTQDDLIAGSYDGTAASTFTSGDVIDGGLGADTLRVAITSAAAAVIPSMKGVEKIEVTDTAGGTINLVNTTGVTSFVAQGSTDETTFDQQNAIAALTIQNGSDFAGVTIKYTAAAVAGTTDVQAVALNNNGSTTDIQGDINVAGVETIAFTNTGANFFDTLETTSTTAITSEGAGSLYFDDAFATTVKTFDASKATGDQTVGFDGNDVTATGGTGNDYFNFNASLTSKDVIDGGTGVNTLALESGDYSAASSEVLKGINASKNIQTLDFYGATGLTINHATLTAAAVNRIQIDTTADDTISGALSAVTYAFGTDNTDDATFTMKGGDLALNLELSGDAESSVGGFDDASIDDLDTGTALTVNLVSKGLSTTAGDINFIDEITTATNTQFNISGDANTSIYWFNSAAVLVDASKLTGNLTVEFLSVFNDSFKGGAGKNYVSGYDGIDTIDLSASSAKVDTVDLSSLTLDNTADYDHRDVISGFKAGSGGDLLQLWAAESSGSGTAGNPVGYQEQGALVGTVNLLGDTDVLEFAFNVAGTGLGDGTAASLNGTNLIAGVGTINAFAGGDEAWIVAYQGGNAYLYHFVEGDAAVGVEFDEISLIATLNGVAVGGVDASNFILN